MEIFREFTFEAAHRLTHVPEGHKCARLHGHSYRVEVHVDGQVGEDTGWVMDFQEIKDAFAPLHDQLDHRYLNEVAGWATRPARTWPSGSGRGWPGLCRYRRSSSARRAPPDVCTGERRLDARRCPGPLR